MNNETEAVIAFDRWWGRISQEPRPMWSMTIIICIGIFVVISMMVVMSICITMVTIGLFTTIAIIANDILS